MALPDTFDKLKELLTQDQFELLLDEEKKEEKKEPESEINYIYNFFTLVFWTFLEKEPLIAVTEKNGKVQNGKFCVYDKRRKKYTRGIDIEEICENLWMELFYRIYGTE